MSLAESLQELGHLVNGKVVRSEQSFPVASPATGEVVAHCPDAGLDLLDEAVAAAQAAQPGWQALGEASRREIVRSLGAAVIEHFGAIDELESLEKGVPMAAVELYMAQVYANHAADTPVPVEVIEDTDDRLVRLVRKPVGVVAAISPWNAPLLIMAEKVFSALVVGNTVVAKPSPFTPLGTLKMAQVWKDLLPPGVLNVLAGGDELGAALVNHRGTSMISFTGSVSAGKKIAAAAGQAMKPVVCELGGNDAAIVLPDVDVKVVAPRIFGSAFLMSGQTCAAVKRLYVHRSIYQSMVDELAGYAKLAVAAPAADGGTVGPLVTRPQFERVSELVRDALDHGAAAAAGGAPAGGNGYYFAPTILTGVGPGVRIVDEEQFGPVLPVIPFDDVEEALAAANATEFGLCGSIWTSDIERGQELADRLQCGTAWVNNHTEVAPHIPFGGVKSSGIGRSGGRPGVDAYSNLQTQIIYKSADRVRG
ncbi:MAG: Aldehyde Dehydrogenase [Actinomycetia bacterium]|nr:Aldehyde Dehydrogenase [Actinomycetes bacterium]